MAPEASYSAVPPLVLLHLSLLPDWYLATWPSSGSGLRPFHCGDINVVTVRYLALGILDSSLLRIMNLQGLFNNLSPLGCVFRRGVLVGATYYQ